jgi:tetratricopeptide (TPR) repeat protein
MPATRYQARDAAAKSIRAGNGALRPRFAWIAAVLLAAGLAVYSRTLGFGFTNFDDPEYVVENPQVRAGLSVESVRWAFTTTHQANWHPLTWLSLMLDAEMGGVDGRAFHRTNVALHLAATLLLFAALDRMTRARWPSAWVAALFAVHPLHVESVAWIAERKDVLSAALGFGTLLAWARWVERPSRGRYALALGLFVSGLLAKPMLVTLPFALLLLDAWPLGRLAGEGGWIGRAPLLLREKIPFFALAAASSAITVAAQRAGGALATFESYPIAWRLGNALISYVLYLRDTFWPSGLAVFYPHPRAELGAVAPALAGLLLAGITGLAWRMRGSRPYVAVGWLWFVGTLVPVIGLVQVGLQARADRYSYVPSVGIFVIAAWGLAEWAGGAGGARGIRRRAAFAFACVSTAALAAAGWVQAGYWRDGITLFERAVAVTGENAVARNNLGSAYYRRNGPGDLERSVEHYAEAVRIHPRYAVAFNNLAGALMRLGRTDEAIARWQDAVRAKPDYVAAHCNLGGALIRAQRIDEGVEHCREAMRLDPNASCAHYNLGLVALKADRLREAESHFAEAVRIDPTYVDSRLNLGVVRAKLGRLGDAADQFREVLRLDPGNEMARLNLERALRR